MKACSSVLLAALVICGSSGCGQCFQCFCSCQTPAGAVQDSNTIFQDGTSAADARSSLQSEFVGTGKLPPGCPPGSTVLDCRCTGGEVSGANCAAALKSALEFFEIVSSEQPCCGEE